MRLEPGDIFLTQGNSFISKAIRVLTRDKGESRTEVNHVGLVTSFGDERTATIVEASSKVIRRTMKSYSDSTSTKVAVYRKRDLTPEQTVHIVDRADQYVGASYGYVKIVAHFLDWLLGGVYFFRRIARMDKYPICSWVVAYAYASAGLNFGVPPSAASPDDIWDWVVDPKHGYEQIHPLELI